jgi:hypothetical protein
MEVLQPVIESGLVAKEALNMYDRYKLTLRIVQNIGVMMSITDVKDPILFPKMENLISSYMYELILLSDASTIQILTTRNDTLWYWYMDRLIAKRGVPKQLKGGAFPVTVLKFIRLFALFIIVVVSTQGAMVSTRTVMTDVIKEGFNDEINLAQNLEGICVTHSNSYAILANKAAVQKTIRESTQIYEEKLKQSVYSIGFQKAKMALGYSAQMPKFEFGIITADTLTVEPGFRLNELESKVQNRIASVEKQLGRKLEPSEAVSIPITFNIIGQPGHALNVIVSGTDFMIMDGDRFNSKMDPYQRRHLGLVQTQGFDGELPYDQANEAQEGTVSLSQTNLVGNTGTYLSQPDLNTAISAYFNRIGIPSGVFPAIVMGIESSNRPVFILESVEEAREGVELLNTELKQLIKKTTESFDELTETHGAVLALKAVANIRESLHRYERSSYNRRHNLGGVHVRILGDIIYKTVVLPIAKYFGIIADSIPLQIENGPVVNQPNILSEPNIADIDGGKRLTQKKKAHKKDRTVRKSIKKTRQTRPRRLNTRSVGSAF